MKLKNDFTALLFASIAVFAISCNQQQTKTETIVADPLPSWNEGTSKQSIVDFVTKTTKEGSADFIPVADRIACFDNDGTLSTEKPLPF